MRAVEERAATLQPPRQARRRLALVAGAALLVLLTLIGYSYVRAYAALHDVDAAMSALADLRREALERHTFDDGKLRAAADSVRAAQHTLGQAGVPMSVTGALPFLGRPVDGVRLAADAADQLTRAAAELQPLFERALGSSSDSGAAGSPVLHEGRIDMGFVAELEDRGERFVAHVRTARDDVLAMPSIPLIGRLRTLQQSADASTAAILRQGERLVSGARLLPRLLGARAPKTYLLAMQNNASLRATGGALLAYGLVRVDDGEIRLLRKGPIGDLIARVGSEMIRPSWPIHWYNAVTRRQPRLNAGLNYTPHFPAVARAWATQLRSSLRRGIDGVIALDQVAVAKALVGQPPFRLASYPAPVTARNVIGLTANLQYGLPAAAQRALPSELIAGAFQLLRDPRDVPSMLTHLGAALTQKHIQIWAADPDAEDLVERLGWDGSLRPGPGDYLLVADDKRSENKIDYFTHFLYEHTVRISPSGDATAFTRVTTEVRIPPGQPFAVARRLIHNGRGPYGVNLAMLNVFVPLRAGPATLETATSPSPGLLVLPKGLLMHPEGGARVFTKVVQASAGHAGVLALRYPIPDVVQPAGDANRYAISLQNQPMINPAHVRVRVILPRGAQVESRDRGWSVRGNVATFSKVLTHDLTMALTYS